MHRRADRDGAAYAFTITNDGATTTGSITPQLAGVDPSQFQIATSTCTTLANGMTCTISIAFAPTSSGAKTAAFSVLANPGGTVTVPLAGSAP